LIVLTDPSELSVRKAVINHGGIPPGGKYIFASFKIVIDFKKFILHNLDVDYPEYTFIISGIT